MPLTHFNDDGRARMVDVSLKPRTDRVATACAVVRLNRATFELVRDGKLKKGDVLAVAQVAGIMGAKRTSDIIPMCHPIALTGADLSFELDESANTVTVSATTRCTGETGVEMEAMTAVTVAALTIYDMCKAVQRDIVIGEVRLTHKSGGKSGTYNAIDS
ncbi:MAG: cyclic pyranopterin monophosphate synthase MoaC [Oscillospiraceae bacterium]|nr:cyclic pyranopterin monophosphate synthase MoaC [Oscillospiraceae bacterium]